MTEDVIDRIEDAISSSREILGSNFWNFQPNWVSQAAFTLLMIHMTDALQALSKMNQRVSFADDIEGGGDVTDLIAKIRNATCHFGSASRNVDGGQVVFLSVAGRAVGLQIDDLVFANPYDDDVAIFYGSLRVFVRRHIHRALIDAQDKVGLVAER